MSAPLIAQVYMMCAMAGALVLAISAVMGGTGHGHAHAHGHAGAGHAGAGHAGPAHGAGHAGPAHGAGHAGPAHGAGHAGPSHGAGHAGPSHGAGHGASHGASHGGAHSANAAQQATTGHHTGPNSAAGANENALPMAARTATAAVRASGGNDLAMFFLTFLNPTVLSAFSVWFGATGLFAWQLLPFLPVILTLPIAIVGGVLGTKATLFAIGTLISRMYASNSFRQDTLIGLQAEVTVSIEGGKTGEITCTAGGPRFTSSAKALRPEECFKRGTQVIISDIRDDIAYVEPWPDDILSIEQTIEVPAERVKEAN